MSMGQVNFQNVINEVCKELLVPIHQKVDQYITDKSDIAVETANIAFDIICQDFPHLNKKFK